MTRIDFAFGAPDRLRMACQVVRKRVLAGQRLVVYCKDGSRLAAFDRMLWAFDDTAFVPHVLAVPLGTAGAILINSISGKVRGALYGLMVAPILMPGAVIGISTPCRRGLSRYASPAPVPSVTTHGVPIR